MADQHLPGTGLRREVAPVFVLVRPQRELVADVVGAARDPGVFRTLRAALRARPQPAAEHRNHLGPLGCRRQGMASHHKCRSAIHVRRRGFGHRPVHPTGTSRPPRGGTLHRNVDAHGALGSRCRPARRAGGRAGHRVDRGAAGTRGGEGGQERVLGAAVAHLDPAEARPALHRAGEVALQPRSVRQEDLPDAAVAAQRVEHLGDRERKRQDAGVQGHRPALTGSDGSR